MTSSLWVLFNALAIAVLIARCFELQGRVSELEQKVSENEKDSRIATVDVGSFLKP